MVCERSTWRSASRCATSPRSWQTHYRGPKGVEPPYDPPMDIVVTVKQVPDPDIPPTHFKIDEAANKVVPPAGVSPVMNGYDAHALEAALRLKEQLGGKVTV